MSVVSIAAALLLAAGVSAGSAGQGHAEQLKVELIPLPNNPATPRMGDALVFRSVIRNDGRPPISGQKVATLPGAAPGQATETEWHLRLIQSGSYKISVMAAARGDALDRDSRPLASPFVAFTVASRPVVETGRVLPIASGRPACDRRYAVVARGGRA